MNIFAMRRVTVDSFRWLFICQSASSPFPYRLVAPVDLFFAIHVMSEMWNRHTYREECEKFWELTSQSKRKTWGLKIHHISMQTQLSYHDKKMGNLENLSNIFKYLVIIVWFLLILWHFALAWFCCFSIARQISGFAILLISLWLTCRIRIFFLSIHFISKTTQKVAPRAGLSHWNALYVSVAFVCCSTGSSNDGEAKKLL